MKRATIALLLICTAAFAQQKGSLTDTRDKKTYKTVKIGKQTWMAENLNYDVKGSVCYDNKPENCAKYGRLYNLSMLGKACPKGWHVSSSKDWLTLMDLVGGYKVAGKKLKAANGWNGNGNGTDQYGFSALPGGYGTLFPDHFLEPGSGFSNSWDGINSFGGWWSGYSCMGEDENEVGEMNEDYYECWPKNSGMSYNSEGVADNIDDGNYSSFAFLSVRCIENKCNNKPYNPETHFCYKDKTYNDKAYQAMQKSYEAQQKAMQKQQEAMKKEPAQNQKAQQEAAQKQQEAAQKYNEALQEISQKYQEAVQKAQQEAMQKYQEALQKAQQEAMQKLTVAQRKAYQETIQKAQQEMQEAPQKALQEAQQKLSAEQQEALQKLPEAQRKAYHEAMQQATQQTVQLRVIQKLPEAQQKAYQGAILKAQQEAMQKYREALQKAQQDALKQQEAAQKYQETIQQSQRKAYQEAIQQVALQEAIQKLPEAQREAILKAQQEAAQKYQEAMQKAQQEPMQKRNEATQKAGQKYQEAMQKAQQ